MDLTLNSFGTITFKLFNGIHAITRNFLKTQSQCVAQASLKHVFDASSMNENWNGEN